MSVVKVSGGYLRVDEVGLDGPVDPGFGNTPPVDPGFGHIGLPPIGSTLPEQPPGVWPPLNWLHPVQPLPPGAPVRPGTIWPSPGHPSAGLPVSPGHPDTGLPPSPGHPDTGLPPDPGHPDAGLPSGGYPSNGLPSKTYWVVAGIPGIGWRYVAVDPSLAVGYPLPPTAAPKA